MHMKKPYRGRFGGVSRPVDRTGHASDRMAAGPGDTDMDMEMGPNEPDADDRGGALSASQGPSPRGRRNFSLTR